MRGLYVFAPLLLLTPPLNWQTTNNETLVNVCVVSGECIGAPCAQRKMQFPERELVAKKLDQAAGTPKLQAKDKGYWENQSCPQDSVTQECDYVVTVTPAGVNRPEPITASQIQTQQAYPAQPPQQPVQSPNAQVAQERQQQPVDQASIKSQLFRVNGCNHIKSQEFRTMESGNGRASDKTTDWLTSKVAEQVRKAIAKDLKGHPRTTP